MTDTLIQIVEALRSEIHMEYGSGHAGSGDHIAGFEEAAKAVLAIVRPTEIRAKKYPLEEFKQGLIRIDFRDHTVADIRLLQKVCAAACPDLECPKYSFSDCYYCEQGRWYAGGAHQLIGNKFDVVTIGEVELSEPKREFVAAPEHAKTKDLVNMIRMKLERRFQTSDYLADSGVEPWSCRSLVTDICQDVMAHVREIHTLAERALNSIEDRVTQ